MKFSHKNNKIRVKTITPEIFKYSDQNPPEIIKYSDQNPPEIFKYSDQKPPEIYRFNIEAFYSSSANV